MIDEQQQRLMGVYKVEYPFNAIDATLFSVLPALARPLEAKEVRRIPITSGSTIYTIVFEELSVAFTLQALDTRLCRMQVSVPYHEIVTEAQLRSTVQRAARENLTELDYATTAIHCRNRSG